MTATINHPTTCDCTACTRIVLRRVQAFEPVYVPDFRMSQIRYEAVGESRRMARGSLPTPIVRSAEVRREAPQRVHLLRCMTRRPRLSLLERVRGMR